MSGGRGPGPKSGGLVRALRNQTAALYPGYFSMVMATGIVSVASYQLEMTTVAWALLWVNVVAYSVLWVLFILRLAWHYRRVMVDLADHSRGPGFFTLVAGTCVLGSQLVVVAGSVTTGGLLLALGLALWFIHIYGFFTAITVREEKPFLAVGINGAWLIAIVATQSVSVLGTLIAGVLTPWAETLFVLTLSMYLFGCMLYILTITLIFYRITFFRLEPAELTPPYWINMGAVAITTLAGATLISAAPQWSFLDEIAPFLKGFTLLFWATATWWIPLLILFGAWRHIYRRYPLRYDPQYWGMVFPLGMYTACTFQLAQAAPLPQLFPIARGFIYIALAAWAVVFIGLLRTLVIGLRAASTAEEPYHEDEGEALHPMPLRVYCPVHRVEADVRVLGGVADGPHSVAGCSLYPGHRNYVPCEAHCVASVAWGTVRSTTPAPTQHRGVERRDRAGPE